MPYKIEGCSLLSLKSELYLVGEFRTFLNWYKTNYFPKIISWIYLPNLDLGKMENALLSNCLNWIFYFSILNFQYHNSSMLAPKKSFSPQMSHVPCYQSLYYYLYGTSTCYSTLVLHSKYILLHFNFVKRPNSWYRKDSNFMSVVWHFLTDLKFWYVYCI